MMSSAAATPRSLQQMVAATHQGGPVRLHVHAGHCLLGVLMQPQLDLRLLLVEDADRAVAKVWMEHECNY